MRGLRRESSAFEAVSLSAAFDNILQRRQFMNFILDRAQDKGENIIMINQCQDFISNLFLCCSSNIFQLLKKCLSNSQCNIHPMLEAMFVPRRKERKRRKRWEMAEMSPCSGLLTPAGWLLPPPDGPEVEDGELPGGDGGGVEARGAEVSSQEHWLGDLHCYAGFFIWHLTSIRILIVTITCVGGQ